MPYEHIFNELDVTAEPFALCELRGQCALALQGQSSATLHYVIEGNGEIVVHNSPPIKIGPGTLVLVPTLRSHTLRSFGNVDRPIPECHPAELGLARHFCETDNPSARGMLVAICSEVSIGLRGTGGLINLVREPLAEVVTSDAGMLGTLERLLRELSSPGLGSKAMIRALLLQCIIHLLRNRLSARDPAVTWMSVLVDEKLWGSLKQMLESPGQPHSVESLARTAGMSRSNFATRFSRAFGNGPMSLLRKLRIQMAARLLTQSQLPVKRIAELVGFDSRSAFSRTFADNTGLPPQRFRSDAHQQ
jgi:AraC-like DNA-binding protein